MLALPHDYRLRCGAPPDSVVESRSLAMDVDQVLLHSRLIGAGVLASQAGEWALAGVGSHV